MTTPSAIEFLRTAHRTARHFGFVPLETLIRPLRMDGYVPTPKASMTHRKLDALSGTLTGGISAYFERALHNGRPTLFFSTDDAPRDAGIVLNLSVVAVRKSIAEALLMQTLRSLVRDLGWTHHTLRINSLGDRDSAVRYTRELGTYLKKRQGDMPPEARELMKESVMGAFLHLIGLNHDLCAKSPNPLDYLSDTSRKHFREIIEHLDMTGTPYEIDARLVGHPHCYADTIFALDLRDTDDTTLFDSPLLVRGGRLDAFVSHILGVDVPAACAVVIFNNKKMPQRIPRPPRAAVPSFFMVQLGFAPKMRSLMLLDALKNANIPVHQQLVSDSLTEQLRQAEAHNVPFSLILGQKEFVENSIIVRDMRSRSQQNIPFDALIPHLKRILKRTS